MPKECYSTCILVLIFFTDMIMSQCYNTESTPLHDQTPLHSANYNGKHDSTEIQKQRALNQYSRQKALL